MPAVVFSPVFFSSRQSIYHRYRYEDNKLAYASSLLPFEAHSSPPEASDWCHNLWSVEVDGEENSISRMPWADADPVPCRSATASCHNARMLIELPNNAEWRWHSILVDTYLESLRSRIVRLARRQVLGK